MYLYLLGLVASVALTPWSVMGQTNQCSRTQAAANGRFACLDNCDENHFAQGNRKYCLSYFPDEGECYLKPYGREDILTCNGQVTANSPPMWMVLIGGSNQYLMLKTMLDQLLPLPADAGYNPTAYWNAERKYTVFLMETY